MDTTTPIRQAAEILARASNAAASSGAGISAESGIATFRDVGGVWDRLNPAEVGTTEGLMCALEQNAGRFVPFFLELLTALEEAEPNPGHVALADLEAMGILKTVITQNIDNLHQEAGSTTVVEVHGNGFRLRCLSCERTVAHPRKELLRETRNSITTLAEYSLSAFIELMPRCDYCGSVMRPDVVMFGESVRALPLAFEAAANCDVMLALGTSGVVFPAANLPYEAKKSGARVIVVNPHENAFSRVSDVYVPMKTGEALPQIVAAVKEIRGVH
ncbi:MAG: SIR2 family NAD-dependent protein deacylase [Desulfosudaceae bacterium]